MDIDRLLLLYSHRPEFFWPAWEAMIAELTPEQVQQMMAGKRLPDPVPKGFGDAAHLCVPRPEQGRP